MKKSVQYTRAIVGSGRDVQGGRRYWQIFALKIVLLLHENGTHVVGCWLSSGV